VQKGRTDPFTAGAVLTGEAGAGVAVMGAALIGVAGGAGYGAGLVVNELPNPLTGESIGQGVQDTFYYLFYTPGW